MIANVLLPIFIAIPMDLVYELIHQSFFSKNIRKCLMKNRNTIDFLSHGSDQELEKSIHHNIHNTICHLIIHWCLLKICAVFVCICASPRFCELIDNKMKNVKFMFINRFMGLSSFEMLLIQIEHVCILYCECKGPFFHVYGNTWLSLGIFLIVLIFLIVPLLVRCKVYMEKRFCSLAPFLSAIIFTIFLEFYHFIIFNIDHLVLEKLIKITNNYKILNSYCKDKSINFVAYNNPDKEYDTCTSSSSFAFSVNAIIYGSLSHFKPKEIEAALLHEAFKHTFVGVVGNTILPLVQRILFAVFLVYFSKRCLKPFCNRNISHVTGFLVLEEVLSMGVERFIFFPIMWLQQYVDGVGDKAIKEAGLGVDYAKFLLHSRMHAHLEIINPSLFYRIFNRENHLFERISKLISK